MTGRSKVFDIALGVSVNLVIALLIIYFIWCLLWLGESVAKLNNANKVQPCEDYGCTHYAYQEDHRKKI